jgi:hypothetical protein
MIFSRHFKKGVEGWEGADRHTIHPANRKWVPIGQFNHVIQ